MWPRSYRVNKTNGQKCPESAVEIAQSGKWLPHKHKDPNSMPETHVKSWVQNLCAGEVGEENPRGLAATQSSQISELLAQ